MSTLQRGAEVPERLPATLRAARVTARLTQKEVAAAMDWSPSKLLRIEGGTVTITTNDLKALLGHYRIIDQHRVDELLTLARASRRQRWRGGRAARAGRATP